MNGWEWCRHIFDTSTSFVQIVLRSICRISWELDFKFESTGIWWPWVDWNSILKGFPSNIYYLITKKLFGVVILEIYFQYYNRNTIIDYVLFVVSKTKSGSVEFSEIAVMDQVEDRIPSYCASKNIWRQQKKRNLNKKVYMHNIQT